MIRTLAVIFYVFFLSGATIVAVDDINGKAGCPCLTELPSTLVNDAAIYDEPKNCLRYEDAGSFFCFPLDYGLAKCAKHDQNLPPYCIDHGFPGVPDFCEQSWCWIDPSNCNQDHYSSSFFPQHNLFYSYQTCGSVNSFISWFSDELPKSMTDFVSIMERYTISTKINIEDRYKDTETYIRTADRDAIDLECTGRNSCFTCSSQCSYNNCWRMDVNFEEANTVFHPILQQMASPQDRDMLGCLGNVVGPSYLKIAYSEHNDPNRIGYMYYGDQRTGAMIQWPETMFCSETFDPRFRPWYASAASGPKDVVIVVDTSGSMTGTRMRLAIESVKAVLQTLTWVDYVTIIGFDSVVNDVYSKVLVPATEENVRAMSEWAERTLDAGGGTEFNEPLRSAYSLLKSSRNTDDHTTCSQVILFMTDGKATLDDINLEQLVNENGGAGAGPTIFSYGVSSDADERALKRMACASNGIYFPVISSDDLPTKMASYYHYFITMLDSCRLSWIKYTDAITGEDLLASCTAIFDYGSTGDLPLELRKLIGVSCLDMNVIVSLDQLKSCQSGGFDEFIAVVRQEAGQCSNFTKITDPCLLSRLRLDVGNISLCDNDLFYNSTCVPEFKPDTKSNCSRLDPDRFSSRLYSCNASAVSNCLEETSNAPDSESDSSSVNFAALGGGIAAGLAVLLVYFIWRSKNNKKNKSEDAKHKQQSELREEQGKDETAGIHFAYDKSVENEELPPLPPPVAPGQSKKSMQQDLPWPSAPHFQ